jgi:putative endonuclease
MRDCHVYILASPSRVLYVGVTSDLARRLHQHKHKLIPGFTSRYGIDQLVHFEHAQDIVVAIAREKEIKGWMRARKVALIETGNPLWRDLSLDWR